MKCGLCSDCALCLSQCQSRQGLMTEVGTGAIRIVKIPLALAQRIANEPGITDGWTLSAKGGKARVRIETLLATVTPDACIACAKCEDACAYKAVEVMLRKGKGQSAVVDHNACRGCGACSGACPTGAISQGWMDEGSLVERIRKGTKSSDRIVAFSCIWNGGGVMRADQNNAIPVICTRRLSPGLILDAFSAGAAGALLIGCEEGGCHYLPAEWNGSNTAEQMGVFLESIGVDRRRVRYAASSGDIGADISRFAEELKGAHLAGFEKIDGKHLASRSSLSRGTISLHALMVQPDIVLKGKPKGASGYLLVPGCVPISGGIEKAYGLPGSAAMLESAEKLLKHLGMEYQRAPFYGHGGTLNEVGLGKLYDRYSKGAVESVRASGAKGLLVLTPETYTQLSSGYAERQGGWGCDLLPLPPLLAKKLAGREFARSEETVAILSPEGNRAFADAIVALLGLMPGLKLVHLKSDCFDWDDSGSEARVRALDVLRRAEKEGARTLVVSSPKCLSFLGAVQSGWRESAVEVIDIYSFILSRMKGGGGDG